MRRWEDVILKTKNQKIYRKGAKSAKKIRRVSKDQEAKTSAANFTDFHELILG